MRGTILLLTLMLACTQAEERGPNVAGAFYPADVEDLNRMLDRFFTKAPELTISGKPILLIEPHAGYIYSGQVAAYGYQLLKPGSYDLVIILGPSHYHYYYGASVDTPVGHRIPTGLIPFDQTIIRRLVKAGIPYVPSAHNREHSIEVQLPFLKKKLKKFKVVEIVIGDYDLEYLKSLAQKIYNATKDKRPLIIASSDLSHYHPYGEAVVIDRRTIKHIKNFEIEPLYQDLKTRRCEACGGAAIITGLYLSRMFGADKVKPLYYSNSGDVTGDSSRVVGYLAAVVYKKERKEIGVGLNLSDDDKRTLRKIASGAIKAVVRNEKFVMPEVSGRLKEKSGAFVTITKQGRLRGCIGFIIGIKPLYETVFEAAQSAATRDSRFPPLSPEELKDIEIEISVLTEPVLVRDLSEIKVGRDGLIIKRGLYQGLLLPQVAVENDWDLDEFLAHTCVKAGLSPDAWKKKGTSIYRFSAEVF